MKTTVPTTRAVWLIRAGAAFLWAFVAVFLAYGVFLVAVGTQAIPRKSPQGEDWTGLFIVFGMFVILVGVTLAGGAFFAGRHPRIGGIVLTFVGVAILAADLVADVGSRASLAGRTMSSVALLLAVSGLLLLSGSRSSGTIQSDPPNS